MTYGYCVYHEIECDYKGSCIDCPHNTKEDTEWFIRQDELQESDLEKREPCINYSDGCEEWAGCPCMYYRAESEK